jgi:hypothetical protein
MHVSSEGFTAGMLALSAACVGTTHPSTLRFLLPVRRHSNKILPAQSTSRFFVQSNRSLYISDFDIDSGNLGFVS